MGGLPKMEVQFKNETKSFTPEEISSMVLVKMKVKLPILFRDFQISVMQVVPRVFDD